MRDDAHQEAATNAKDDEAEEGAAYEVGSQLDDSPPPLDNTNIDQLRFGVRVAVTLGSNSPQESR
jgi:hypothetical protein